MEVLNKIVIKRTNGLASVQDFGRRGGYSVGFTRGGPMDEHAFAWSNRLLNNPLNTAAIEVTFGQFEVVFDTDCRIAITGADMNASIGFDFVRPWQTYDVKAGQAVRFRGGDSGLRSYLAVSGGILANKVFGSAATISRESVLGLQDPIAVGDTLGFSDQTNSKDSFVRRTPWEFIPTYRSSVELEYISGGQCDEFDENDRRIFETSAFTLSQDMDRMGCRLGGPRLISGPKGIRSEGMTRGMIQIPSDGHPIILMNDHQTIGGYPTLGCLTHQSCNQLSQCRPGDEVRFIKTEVGEAQIERFQFLKYFSILC